MTQAGLEKIDPFHTDPFVGEHGPWKQQDAC